MSKVFFFVGLLMSSILSAQIPCKNGLAGAYPCKNVDLLSHMSPDELGAEELDNKWLNDIWGWTDPLDGKEYALVGLVNGTSFVDISNPSEPIFLGVLNEHNFVDPTAKIAHNDAKSIWRDIKVYKNHAFIVSEDLEHGMQVFDLAELRDRSNVPRDYIETAHYDGLSNAHNLVLNEETGFAYAVGANKSNNGCTLGGLHIIDVRDPKNPSFAGCFDGLGYTHDAQVVNYHGPDSTYMGREIAFNCNIFQFVIADVTDKMNPDLISTSFYDSSAYMHQGWLTEDHQFFLANDEHDETRFQKNTKTFIWNVRDLDHPVNTGLFLSTQESIDHNLYMKGRYSYQSNYTSGLRILNASLLEDTTLLEAAYFDTYLLNDFRTIAGTWSNYPFFESGVVVVSDIQNGLFILQPHLSFDLEKQPQNELICTNGDEISFKVVSSDTNCTYQWQENRNGFFLSLKDDSIYSGTTKSTLRLNDYIEDVFQYNYRCVVTDEMGRFIYSDTLNAVLDKGNNVDFEVQENEGVFEFASIVDKTGEYFWDFGDGATAVGINQVSYIYENGGSYMATLSIENECGKFEETKDITVLTSLDKKIVENNIFLFPSPVNGKLNIQIDDLPLGTLDIAIYDLHGRVVKEEQASIFNKSELVSLDLSFLIDGVYVIRLTKNNELLFQNSVIVR